MFGPKQLEVINSPVSGELRVMKSMGGGIFVATGALTQSGAIIKQLWEPILNKIAQKNKTWLILGLGAGSLATEIAKKYSPAKIVGIELDPAMVDIGYRYFDLDKIPSLEVKITDAKGFIQKNKSSFDYVFVDMYQGDQLPEFVYNPKFIAQLTKTGDKVIFNHLFYDDQKKANTQKLIEILEKYFSSIIPIRSLTNLLLISSN